MSICQLFACGTLRSHVPPRAQEHGVSLSPPQLMPTGQWARLRAQLTLHVQKGSRCQEVTIHVHKQTKAGEEDANMVLPF